MEVTRAQQTRAWRRVCGRSALSRLHDTQHSAADVRRASQPCARTVGLGLRSTSPQDMRYRCSRRTHGDVRADGRLWVGYMISGASVEDVRTATCVRTVGLRVNHTGYATTDKDRRGGGTQTGAAGGGYGREEQQLGSGACLDVCHIRAHGDVRADGRP